MYFMSMSDRITPERFRLNMMKTITGVPVVNNITEAGSRETENTQTTESREAQSDEIL